MNLQEFKAREMEIKAKLLVLTPQETSLYQKGLLDKKELSKIQKRREWVHDPVNRLGNLIFGASF